MKIFSFNLGINIKRYWFHGIWMLFQKSCLCANFNGCSIICIGVHTFGVFVWYCQKIVRHFFTFVHELYIFQQGIKIFGPNFSYSIFEALSKLDWLTHRGLILVLYGWPHKTSNMYLTSLEIGICFLIITKKLLKLAFLRPLTL